MIAKKYISENKQIWDTFIDNSKNGTFMLKRDYIEYHADRFVDFSLMFFENDNLLAVMPASIHGDEVRSHGGLTYGGFIMNKKMTASKMLELSDVLKTFLKENHVTKFIYKKIPRVYETYPCDEDLYALFINDAKLIRRDISTAVLLGNKIEFSELRRRGVKKAIKNGVIIQESLDYDGYIAMLTKILEEYHAAKPVHSSAEIEKLASLFPQNIKLFTAMKDNIMLAGVVTFETPTVVHAQYIANSNQGREIGALDFVMDFLINTYSVDKKWFDFGVSTENDGRYLNTGLIAQKEGFGGRAIVYDFYEWNIK